MACPPTKVKFQFRRALESEWNFKNPVLNPGEPGYAINTHVLKIGDGIKHWRDLPALTKAIYTDTQLISENAPISPKPRFCRIFDGGSYKAKSQPVIALRNSFKVLDGGKPFRI